MVLSPDDIHKIRLAIIPEIDARLNFFYEEKLRGRFDLVDTNFDRLFHWRESIQVEKDVSTAQYHRQEEKLDGYESRLKTLEAKWS